MPLHLQEEKEVAVTPSREVVTNFVEPGIFKVYKGEIELRNCTSKPVFLKKNLPIADICTVKKISTQL